MEELDTLVKQAQTGDLDAFGTVVRRFQDMAVGYAYAQLGDFHLAEDAAQEAFLAAYLSLPQLREPSAFPGWFRRVVSTHANRVARGKRIPTVELDRALEVASEEKGPDERLDEQDLKAHVLAAIQTLPAQCFENPAREVLHAIERCFSDALDTEVTVDILSVSQSTYAQFIESVSSPSLTLHFTMKPTAGRISFDLSPTLAFALRDRLSGNQASAWKDEVSTLTADDWKRLNPIARDIMAHLEDIWQPVPDVEMSDGEWETNIVGLKARPEYWNDQSRRLFGALEDAPIDPVVHIKMALKSEDVSCLLGLCYPACTLESILPYLGR